MAKKEKTSEELELEKQKLLEKETIKAEKEEAKKKQKLEKQSKKLETLTSKRDSLQEKLSAIQEEYNKEYTAWKESNSNKIPSKLNVLDHKLQRQKKSLLKVQLKIEAIEKGHFYDPRDCILYASDLEIYEDKPKIEKRLQKAIDKKAKDKNRYLSYINKRKAKGRQANKRVYRLGKRVNHDEVLVKYNQIQLENMEKGTYVHLSVFQEIKRKFSQIPYETQKKIWGVIFITPWIAGLIIFFLIPLFQTIWFSFNSVRPNGNTIEIIFDGFGQYKYTFNTYTYYGYLYLQELWNSLKDTLINVPVILIFSLFIAVLLNTDFKGARFIKVIFFIPVVYNATIINTIVNGSVGSRLQSGMTSKLNFKDSFTSFLLQMGLGAKIITFITSVTGRIQSIINLSGVQILIFLAAIQSIPGNLYEAADMEGCTAYEKFWKITFPMVTPMFLTCVIYTIVDSFTRSSVLSMINDARVSLQKYGVASAMAVLYFLFNTLIIVIVFLALKGVVFYYDDRK